MTEQQITAPHFLDNLLELGIRPDTHHSQIKAVVADLLGDRPTPDQTKQLRAALKQHNRPPYIARRRLKLLGVRYMPGDAVPLDEVDNRTRKLLVESSLVVRGGDHG